MLIGEYEHKMDSKRRLPLPARLRSQLGLKVVITRGLEGCLFVYSVGGWEEFSAKLRALPMSQATSRSFVRLVFSGAVEVELDNLGRVLIPDYLKEHAELSKNVVVIGTGERLEIWDQERWKAYHVRQQREMEANAETLKEFGI